MYVATSEKFIIPSVRYVDLYGTDMETGQPLSERLKP
jgi:hypothetical protein